MCLAPSMMPQRAAASNFSLPPIAAPRRSVRDLAVIAHLAHGNLVNAVPSPCRFRCHPKDRPRRRPPPKVHVAVSSSRVLSRPAHTFATPHGHRGWMTPSSRRRACHAQRAALAGHTAASIDSNSRPPPPRPPVTCQCGRSPRPARSGPAHAEGTCRGSSRSPLSIVLFFVDRSFDALREIFAIVALQLYARPPPVVYRPMGRAVPAAALHLGRLDSVCLDLLGCSSALRCSLLVLVYPGRLLTSHGSSSGAECSCCCGQMTIPSRQV